ncbi:MAG: peptidylprolyl isomerase [Ilumatobacteraceae bacterium]|nr:peptidylprolyl isomerase [Ilumatobacteraceae bacterium]
MTRRVRSTALVAGALALVLGLAACGSSDNGDAATTTTVASSSGEGPESCAPVGEIPEAEGKPTSIDAPSEPAKGDVKVTVLEEGDGPEATDTSYVTVHYVGVACSSGEQFDSSWDRGEPISIAMPGAPPTDTAFSVIPGWNQGLLGQKQGALVQLDIPSDLAYGPTGGQGIAPNDPLTFVIEVVKVSDTAPAA